MKKINISIKTLISSMLLIVLECAYPVLFIYFQNIDEVNVGDIIVPLITYYLIAFIFFAATFLVFWNIEKTAVITFIMMLFFMNFALIQNLVVILFPFCTYMGLGIAIVILLLVIGVLLKKNNIDYSTGIVIGNCVLFVLILVNCITAIKIVYNGKKKVKNIKVEQYARDKSFDGNVYYFILDEYGGEQNLNYYCNYENDEMKSYMENLGFAWSDDSYNKESISTYSIVPNILNLNYVTEVDGVPSYNMQYTKNPVMYRFFRKLGYDINIINHTGFLDDSNGESILKKQYLSTTPTDDMFVSKIILKQSLIPIILEEYTKVTDKKIKESTEGSSDAVLLDDVISCSKNICTYNKKKPTLNVAYIQCPHAPFIYDDKGNYNIIDDTHDYADIELYVNQLKYINSQVKIITENIIKNDPNSIIVFQSDHGYRYAEHCMYLYKRKDYDAKLETNMMQNVLNCVYVAGKKIDIDGKSCINTWRTILNDVYGTDYKMIDCDEEYIYKWFYTNVKDI